MNGQRDYVLTADFVKDFQKLEDDKRALEAELRALKKETPQPTPILPGPPEEIERLKKVLGGCQDLAACTAAVEKLRDERDTLRSKNGDLATEVEKLRGDCEDMRRLVKHRDMAQPAIDKMRSESESLRRQNQDLTSRVKTLQARCDELELLIDPDLSRKLKDYKLRYERVLKELEAAEQDRSQLHRQLIDCERKLYGD